MIAHLGSRHSGEATNGATAKMACCLEKQMSFLKNPPTSPSVERVGSFVIQLILILIIIHQHIMLASRCPMPKHPT